MEGMGKAKKIILGILYWIWSLTWGGLLSWPGLIITGFCILFLKGRVHANGFSYIVEVGGNWGGLDIGCVSICGTYYPDYYYEHVRRHEFGHSLQQLIFGPLQLFVVNIPSAIRYWVFRIRASKGLPNPPYDQAIFEYTASKWGYDAIDAIEGRTENSPYYTYERL